MAVPKYDELMGPVLKALSREQTLTARALRSRIAALLSLTEEDLAEMLPSQRQPTFVNRVHWAVTYLKKSGLISSPGRGAYSITPRGAAALAETSGVITNQYLMKFAEYREFIRGSSDVPTVSPGSALPDTPSVPTSQDGQTPQDVIGSAIERINRSLSDDLLAEIMQKSPAFFEHLVVELLVRMGYGGTLEDAGTVVGRSGDEGIDGIIREDKLGFSSIYIQAKRWDPASSIGRPEVQKFVGALAGQGATKGLFITTAQFTKDAVAFIERQHTTRIVLVDGAKLTRLMIEYDLGVSTQNVFAIKKIDSDYFDSDD